MSRFALSLLAGVGIVAGALSAQAQAQPTGSWPASEAFSTGNGFTVGGSASDGTYLYILGGYWQSTTEFRRYDPVNDSWEDLPSLPEDNAYFRAAHVGGYIYILGNGYYGNGEIYRYDIAGEFWDGSFGSLENSRYQVGAAVHADKIYIAGGYDNFNGGRSTALQVFDPSDLSLTTLADMPIGLTLPFGAGLPNGRVYFAGGQSDNGDSSDCLEYDPASDSWSTRAPISNGTTTQTRYFPGGFALNGRLYVVGGNGTNGYSNTTLEYSPSTNTWAQRASLNEARYGFAFGVIGDFGYVYGGESNDAYYDRERFTPPDFGSAPFLPVDIAQVGSQSSSSEQGGWTDSQMRFQATITDPDGAQQVRLEVQVRPSGSQAWSAVLSSGNGPQGLHVVAYSVPANGTYDWRWRVADANSNYTPSSGGLPGWVEAFDNAVSPDFRSDQIVPATPVAISPAGIDVQVIDAAGGPVTLNWQESTDNGPASAITYDIQVARDAIFGDIEAQIFSTAGQNSATVNLSEARTDKFWRLRARDIGGNFSAWSNVQTFRVTFNDGRDHASGDAKKGCGFGVEAASYGSLTGLLLGLAILASASRRRQSAGVVRVSNRRKLS